MRGWVPGLEHGAGLAEQHIVYAGPDPSARASRIGFRMFPVMIVLMSPHRTAPRSARRFHALDPCRE